MTLAVRSLIGFVILLLLVWVVAHVVSGRREAAIEAKFPPTGQLVTVNGLRVHAQVMGNGPDVVLIHGLSGNLRDMTFRLGPALAKDFRVIMFDRPGLGYSDPLPEDSIVDQAQHLQAAAEQLGAEKPIVLGHSYGGAVALAWATSMPEKLSGLLVLAGVSNPWDTPMSFYYWLVTRPVLGTFASPLLVAFVPDSYVDRQVQSAFDPQDPIADYADHLGPRLVLRRDVVRVNAYQRKHLLEQVKELVPLYDDISVPTAIIHGDSDPSVSHIIHARPLSEQIPHSNYFELPGMGHMPHQLAVEEIQSALTQLSRD